MEIFIYHEDASRTLAFTKAGDVQKCIEDYRFSRYNKCNKLLL